MTAWLLEQGRVYFGNANSVKEYRIQLRSTKTVWYWSVYLGILVLVAIANYGSIGIATSGQSAAGVQSALTTYYQLVTGFVHAALLLIAPMLAASAIVTEYELRSIELVQCAPVSTKYFFVGKFLSCLRQIMLLLFLALPIAAVGVTLGGASWPQILEQFGYIAMQAALFSAIAMPLAVVSKSVLRAVAGVIGAGFVITALGSGIVAIYASAGGSGIPAITGLLPFMSAFSVGQATQVGSMSVPNWMLTLLMCAILIRVVLLGAGSAVTRVGSKETMSLRIHGLVLTGLFAVLVGVGLSTMPVMGTTGLVRYRMTTMMIGLPMIIGFIQILAVSAHGRLEERKFFADRLFVLMDTFKGRPSGGAGYSLLVTLLLGIGVSLPMVASGMFGWLDVLPGIAWCLCFAFFAFALTWSVSTGFDQAVPARRATAGLLVAGLAVMHFVGLSVDGARRDFESLYMFALNPFMPMANSLGGAIGKCVALLMLGVLLIIVGEGRRRKNLEILRQNGYLVDRNEIESAA